MPGQNSRQLQVDGDERLRGTAPSVPLWLKLAYTAFVCAIVPVYWERYGAANFLWFSDIGLIVTAAALWLENRLLASMMAVGVVPLEIGWNLDFLTGGALFGWTMSALDPELPRIVWLLSLYHMPLPVIVVWLVHRLGYDPRALYWQTGAAWAVLLVTRLLTDPARNINWVFGLGSGAWSFEPSYLYLSALMAALPLAVFLPAHLVLGRLFAAGAARRAAP